MKTITVKGVGNASVKPDYIVLSLTLESGSLDYKAAMDIAAMKISELTKEVVRIGFEKDAVKTTDFDIRTDYDSERDRNGNYRRIFNGYVVRHRLKIAFDFDTKVLAKTLSTIANCVAEPELSIRFTVKDTAAISQALLASAAENARKKAEILCAASGVALGELEHIDYNWGEVNVYSDTRYEMDYKCMCAPAAADIDIEPDDVRASDTVAFVWQIG